MWFGTHPDWTGDDVYVDYIVKNGIWFGTLMEWTDMVFMLTK